MPRIKMRFQTLPDDDGETPKKDRALAAMAGKGNDDLYITWQDVLSYAPEEDRFKWVKRIQDGIEYCPGREEGDASGRRPRDARARRRGWHRDEDWGRLDICEARRRDGGKVPEHRATLLGYRL